MRSITIDLSQNSYDVLTWESGDGNVAAHCTAILSKRAVALMQPYTFQVGQAAIQEKAAYGARVLKLDQKELDAIEAKILAVEAADATEPEPKEGL